MPSNILDTPPSLTERLAAGFFLGDILVSADNSWLEPGGPRAGSGGVKVTGAQASVGRWF